MLLITMTIGMVVRFSLFFVIVVAVVDPRRLERHHRLFVSGRHCNGRRVARQRQLSCIPPYYLNYAYPEQQPSIPFPSSAHSHR